MHHQKQKSQQPQYDQQCNHQNQIISSRWLYLCWNTSSSSSSSSSLKRRNCRCNCRRLTMVMFLLCIYIIGSNYIVDVNYRTYNIDTTTTYNNNLQPTTTLATTTVTTANELRPTTTTNTNTNTTTSQQSSVTTDGDDIPVTTATATEVADNKTTDAKKERVTTTLEYTTSRPTQVLSTNHTSSNGNSNKSSLLFLKSIKRDNSNKIKNNIYLNYNNDTNDTRYNENTTRIHFNTSTKTETQKSLSSSLSSSSSLSLSSLVSFSSHIQQIQTSVSFSSLSKSKSKPPVWIKSYFKWHAKQILKLNETNWNNKKYYVIRCLIRDKLCGGLADRLTSIPIHVYLAYKYKRILFIKWEFPTKLENFLVPPSSSSKSTSSSRNNSRKFRSYDFLNWSIPYWLESKLSTYYNDIPTLVQYRFLNKRLRQNNNRIVIDAKFAPRRHHGDTYYDNAIYPLFNGSIVSKKYKFHKVVRLLWYKLFQPTKRIIHKIQNQLNLLQLQPNYYNSLHIRSHYSHDASSDVQMIRNATNCGISLFFSNRTITNTATSNGKNNIINKLYIASDSKKATQTSLDYVISSNKKIKRNNNNMLLPFNNIYNNTESTTSTTNVNNNIIGTTRKQEQEQEHQNNTNKKIFFKNLHIDEDESSNIEAFDDTFIDIYLLSMSRCIAYGCGEFGSLANILSMDQSCFISYFQYKQPGQRARFNWSKCF